MPQDNPEDSLLEDLFEEPLFIEMDRKRIKRARITLFVLAGIQLLPLSIYFLRDYLIDLNFAFIIGYTLLLAAAFIGLGLWTKKKPYTAIILSLVLYTLLLGYHILFSHYNWWSGGIIRVVVYVILINALKSAKLVQAWQDMKQKSK